MIRDDADVYEAWNYGDDPHYMLAITANMHSYI